MVHAPNRPPAGAPPTRINLYSDTQTRPTPAMKEAMMRAEVGDEQHGDDPTVHALCDRMAALMGKAAAMYLPSGTMCNVIAILTHCGKGDEVIAHETSHILHSEGGTHAALTGVQIMPMKGPRGMFTAEDVRAAVIEGAGELLEAAVVVDDYRGTGIPEGQKSLTFALRFRAADRTLTANDATEAKLAGVAVAHSRFNATIRE